MILVWVLMPIDMVADCTVLDVQDGTPCALNYTALWDNKLVYYNDFFVNVRAKGVSVSSMFTGPQCRCGSPPFP